VAERLTTKERRNEDFYFTASGVPADCRIFLCYRLSTESRHDIPCCSPFFSYISRVKGLTKQEQLVLCVVLGLLLTGLAVKTYRAAHPPTTTTQPAKP